MAKATSAWDGYIDGRKASPGVYVYMLKYGMNQDMIQGAVTLIY